MLDGQRTTSSSTRAMPDTLSTTQSTSSAWTPSATSESVSAPRSRIGVPSRRWTVPAVGIVESTAPDSLIDSFVASEPEDQGAREAFRRRQEGGLARRKRRACTQAVLLREDLPTHHSPLVAGEQARHLVGQPSLDLSNPLTRHPVLRPDVTQRAERCLHEPVLEDVAVPRLHLVEPIGQHGLGIGGWRGVRDLSGTQAVERLGDVGRQDLTDNRPFDVSPRPQRPRKPGPVNE